MRTKRTKNQAKGKVLVNENANVNQI